jgi:hypothetical protein
LLTSKIIILELGFFDGIYLKLGSFASDQYLPDRSPIMHEYPVRVVFDDPRRREESTMVMWATGKSKSASRVLDSVDKLTARRRPDAAKPHARAK